jgi:hypothetical protein
MKVKIGNAIYRVACLIGAFIMYRFMPSIRSESIPEEKVIFAVGLTTIFLAFGWTIRYILSGNKTFRF